MKGTVAASTSQIETERLRFGTADLCAKNRSIDSAPEIEKRRRRVEGSSASKDDFFLNYSRKKKC